MNTIKRYARVSLFLAFSLTMYYLTGRDPLTFSDIAATSIFSDAMIQPRSPYTFILEPSVDLISPPARWTSVTFVKSACANEGRRKAIRDTWAGMKSFRGGRFITIFIVGRSNEDGIVSRVRAEHERYGDILLLDLIDTAEHVPDKILASMQWAGEHLPKTWIYSSADDDMSLHVPNFASYIDNIIEKTSLHAKSIESSTINMPTMCVYSYKQSDTPNRDQNSKWYMPEELYSPTYWPPYCRGGWYSMPVNLTANLFRISRRMKYFPLDDVWITGLMRIKYLKEICQNEDYIVNGMLDAAPLSMRPDLLLMFNIFEPVSRVIVSHNWGNVSHRSVDVEHNLRLRWKEWSRSFPGRQ